MKLLLCSLGHLLILVQRVIALSRQCPVSMKAPPTCQTAERHSHLSLLSPFPTTQVSVCFYCFSMVYKQQCNNDFTLSKTLTPHSQQNFSYVCPWTLMDSCIILLYIWEIFFVMVPYLLFSTYFQQTRSSACNSYSECSYSYIYMMIYPFINTFIWWSAHEGYLK